MLQMVADRLAGSDGKGSQQMAARIQGPFDGHTWPVGKESVYSKLIFASGGIGCTGILSHLQRAAMRRAAGDKGEPPPPYRTSAMPALPQQVSADVQNVLKRMLKCMHVIETRLELEFLQLFACNILQHCIIAQFIFSGDDFHNY